MEAVLMIISFIVYVKLLRQKNAWGWIVLYWAALVSKNLTEVVF